MHAAPLVGLAAFAAICQAAALPSSPMTCQDIVIPVSASADNFELPAGLSLIDLTAAFLDGVAELSTAPVNGQYNIGARYCEPSPPVPNRQQTLQVLVHGVTYTRNYWSGLAAPGTPGREEYSWILYAAQQGYPTLSLDRLCNGLSSHPDGLTTCQLPLEAEVVHEIISIARAGELPGVSTQFNKIIVAGHSYGSLLSSTLAIQHPDDIDALLLTGFSFGVETGLPGVVPPLFVPAAVADPALFEGLDITYLAAASRAGVQQLFYYGQFDHALAADDFAHRGTFTVGELATITPGLLPVPGYQGPLYVLNGNEDFIFCQVTPLSPLLGLPGDCDAGFDQTVGSFYSAASTFGFSNTANTGHCLNLHQTAQQSFTAAHEFLQQAGF
jgi:pimeloyl-ACP methyl ester carboxylesterase